MKNIKKIIKIYIEILLVVKNKIYHKKYPSNPDGKINIHLGCGEINSDGFINVDSRALPHIHHIRNVTNLSVFKDNFADLVYASHILEHLPMLNLRPVLNEWRRVLKPGGVLRLGVPDFDTIIQIYNDNNKNIEFIWRALLGGQDYKQNFHFAVLNGNYLMSILQDCGFKEIKKWAAKEVSQHNFDDWTSTDYIVNGKSYPISLNIEAIK